MTDTLTGLWGDRADRIQDSIERLYGAPWPQFLHNAWPVEDADDSTFNYWWLAHLIDVRLDAYERTGDPARLEQARSVHRNIVERNGGSLFNDYFDDMLWFALATLRLHDATGERQYLDDAVALFDHVVEHGWNDAGGTSLAWRKQQLAYKNTPANGPLVILGARLHRTTGDDRFVRYADTAFDWLTEHLVDVSDGFVEDGVNREGDGRVDTQWRFTYNQGLYLGAAVELADRRPDDDLLAVAVRTARTAVTELSDGVVFRQEGDGGDEGLFKGVYYRYLGLLLERLPDGDADRVALTAFVRASTDALWGAFPEELDRPAANDWTELPVGTVPYSTQLSAAMATELRARLDP
ncbi:glycoside hydrolase family 76 protein [Curtobacterium sp. MCBD17_023]|uniref:glycoside hydrolase family 76 protein n=1 Tax=Curtobacterium sp. MCBD17_023 TaxID=2175657 RepID=UPI000D8344F2|nr:glycoside hydrolase family 76 protein [Curtobacterium sp. MCBD17_023]PYY49678.1 glycoside hydrolase [Curtobacterium sp. MCBD17_023]